MGTSLRLPLVTLGTFPDLDWLFDDRPIKARKRQAEADEDADDDDDEDEDATGADADDESDEDQDDSSDDDDSDDDDDADADDEDDDEEEDSSKRRSKKSGFKAPKSQAEFDRMVLDRLKRQETQIERDVRKRIKAEQDLADAKKNKDSTKTIQLLEQKVNDLTEELNKSKARDLRERVAEKVGLPLSMAKRLVGETEAQLIADAKELKKTVKPAERRTRNSDPDTGQSNRNNSRSKKGADDDEEWKKPGYFTQDY